MPQYWHIYFQHINHEDPPSLRHACPRTRANCYQVKTCRAYGLRPPCTSPPRAPSRAPPIALTQWTSPFTLFSPPVFSHLHCRLQYAALRSVAWCLIMSCTVVISSHELDLPGRNLLCLLQPPPPLSYCTHSPFIILSIFAGGLEGWRAGGREVGGGSCTIACVHLIIIITVACPVRCT